jgi:hypothetical protein
MQMSREELGGLQANEGIVLGSIQIRGGKDLLGRTKWNLAAKRTDNTGSEYSIAANREGEEEFFITRMAAGDYRIYRLYQEGFSTFSASASVYFKVEPGKTKYIGRLVVEFPPGLITITTPVKMTVEDAKEKALDKVSQRAGIAVGDVATDLLTTVAEAAAGAPLPGKTTAGSLLERDTLSTLIALDQAEDKDCKERKLVNREIVSANAQRAEEHWFVNRCGKLVRYRITYQPDSRGGTNIGWAPGEVIGKAE